MPVPSLTLEPGVGQSASSKPSIPVPANIPIADQPKATISAASPPSKNAGPDPGSQPNDSAISARPQSQSGPNAVKPTKIQGSNDPQQGNDPPKSKDPKQEYNPSQASNPTKANDPTRGSGNGGDSGQDAGSKAKDDPIQVNSQGSHQNVAPFPQNDPKQTYQVDPADDFKEGQAKTINNQIIQPLSHGISIAGTTLTPGASSITVSGTPIHFGLSTLVVGTSTVPLASGDPNSITTTIAGHVITAAPNRIAVAGTSLTRGAPPITVSGTPIHFGSSALIVGTSTVPLAPEIPTQMTTTIGGQAITAVSNVVAIAGNTLSPGAPGTTVDGTVLSLDSAGRFVVGSRTISLASMVPQTVTTKIAGQAVTAAPNAVTVAGTILSPGDPGITLAGTLISLNTASQLIVGPKTLALESESQKSILTEIGGQVITAAPNSLAIAGTALTPGASGVTVGSKTIPLQSEKAGSSEQTAGLNGLILGAFGSGGPLGPFESSSASPTQGNFSTGGANGTSAGVQVFQGGATSVERRHWWSMVVVSAIVTAALMYVC